MAAMKFTGLMGTQIVEDVNGTMKNAKKLVGSKRYRRPEKAMGIALTSHCIDQRHNWTAVDPYAGAIPRNVVLAQDVFQSPLANDSAPFKQIVTTNSTADYWSPTAQGMMAPVLDLTLVRDCYKEGDFAAMAFSWLGGLIHLYCYCCCAYAVALLCFA